MMIRRIEHVLLIEDDPITNFLNERIVRKLNISNKVDVANNGQEALEYLEAMKETDQPFPELILLDINMPIMDGFEFLEKYSHLNPIIGTNTIIVMLTSSNHIKDMENLLRFENADFLSKPLTEEKLVSIMNKYFTVQPFGQTA